MRDIILSIKPEYAEMIYFGEKKYELRKVIPKQMEANRSALVRGFDENLEVAVYIYESKPVGMITGIINFYEICRANKEYLRWNYLHLLGISEEDFYKYLGCRTHGYCLQICNVERFDKPLKLNCHAPQNFMYLKEGMLEEIKDGKKD